MGDALALALLKAKGFGVEDFARAHPGGILGRRLLVRVRDVMRSGKELPRVPASASLSEALLEMSRKGLGMTAIVGSDGRVLGIFTDGDLRRTLEAGVDIRVAKVESVMKRNPHQISSEKLASEAVKYMEKFRINGLIVTDEDGRLVGAFNMHDLFRAGVV
jgi:arabinose-5-phosphate isomerase